MIAWDMTDKSNPTPIVYCDGCGNECTKDGIEIDGKNYCAKCLNMYQYTTQFQGRWESDEA